MTKFAIVGNRVPHKYFLTTGKGESDAGSKFLPAETGSYDAALNDAGIEDANVIKYTSVMPTEAKEIPRSEGTKDIRWGEVLESIMAQTNGKTGDHISAAVMITSVKNPQGKYLGGFACEYSGNGNETDAQQSLVKSVSEMIERRGYGKSRSPDKRGGFNKNITTDKGYVYHPGFHWVWSDMTVKKEHGTVLASICFRSYKVPIIEIPASIKKGGKSTRRKKTRKQKKRNR